MYPPKALLITLNFVLTVLSITTIISGLSIPDRLPRELSRLVKISGLSDYSKIFIVGGTILFAINMFCFWCIDEENRAGLFAYKTLLLFFVVLEIAMPVQEFYNRDKSEKALKLEIGKLSGHDLDRMQSFLHCCNLPESKSKTPRNSCCPADRILSGKKCNIQNIFPGKCTQVVYNFFQNRKERLVWYILRLIFPQVGAIIFADLFSRHVKYMRNLLTFT